MSEPQSKRKARSNAGHESPGSGTARASHDHERASPASARLGAFYAAGPSIGLGAPTQTKLEVNRPGDAYEQEADAVASRVTSGDTLAPPAISPLAPGALARAMPAAGEKKPEQKTTQKAEAKQPEKKPEQKTTQKAEAKQPEKKPEQKTTQKAEAKQPEKKPEQKTTQKAEAKQPEKKPEQKTTQKAEEHAPTSGGAAHQAGDPAAAEQAMAHAGPGRPMQPETRRTLESRMGADLSDVRIHDDSAAQQAAGDLNARAFTQGHDIWLAGGESDRDLGLMAHEAAHVVQQSGGSDTRRKLQRKERPGAAQPAAIGAQPLAADPKAAQRQPVQRAGSPPAGAATSATGAPTSSGGANGAPPSIEIDSLTLPEFKLKGRESLFQGRKFFRAAGYKASVSRKGEDDPKQSQEWSDLIEKSIGGISGKLAGTPFNMKPANSYLLRATGKGDTYDRIGNADTIAAGLKRPFWDDKGKFKNYQVDHIVDLQIAGWPREKWANDPNTYYELLDQSANTKAGPMIATEINKAVTNYLKDPQKSAGIPKEDRQVEKVKQKYDIVFKNFAPGPNPPGGVSRWSKEDVSIGKHIDELGNKPKSSRDIKAYDIKTPDQPDSTPYTTLPDNLRGDSLTGSRTKFVIYKGGTAGGKRVALKWDANGPDERELDANESKSIGVKGFDVKKVRFNRAPDGAPPQGFYTGTLFGKLYKRQKDNTVLEGPDDFNWLAYRVPGTEHAGYLQTSQLIKEIGNQFKFPKLSPIEIRGATIDDEKGLVVVCKILPTVPLFEKLDIDLVLEGDDIRLRRLFSPGDLKLPGPIKITGSSLEVFAGTNGVGVDGNMLFEIERIGTGQIGGSASTGKGIALNGDFTLDKKLFDGEAKIEAWYRDNAFGAKGRLAIGRGKLKGVKSASVEALYEKDTFSGDIKAEFDFPGVKSASVSLRQSPQEGLLIDGGFELANNLPGIKGGSGQVQIRRRPGSDEYEVAAKGKAQAGVAGITADLTLDYNNGAFDITGSVPFEKGMLKGQLTMGATNRPIGPDGRPSGPPADKSDKVTLYGQGSASLKLAPWLQATAAIRLLPNGEIEVTGKIGLPQTLDIFPGKNYDKNIFRIGIDIPIVGVSVAGQRIGVFANITGGLDLSAGIGPGQLQELGLEVTYNPAHEDQTHVSGGAKLHIPAHAGVRLFVRGGLGVGIPIVSAQAGLEIGGALGLEGALDAGVQVDWTPLQGLKIDAFGEIYVEPKLKFDITGFVLVEADLLLTTVELYSKRWQLAAFEYGSGLRLGMKFPVHYQEGKPFEISLSDVQFEVPQIEPRAVLSDLVKKLA